MKETMPLILILALCLMADGLMAIGPAAFFLAGVVVFGAVGVLER